MMKSQGKINLFLTAEKQRAQRGNVAAE